MSTTNADAPKVTPAAPAEGRPAQSVKPKPASYERRLKQLDDRQLLMEVQKQTRSEIQGRRYHGVALGTVLAALLESHIKGAPTLG